MKLVRDDTNQGYEAGMLAENPFEYEHSSARFYICGEQVKYPVMNFGELDDINLTGYSGYAAVLRLALIARAETRLRT